MFRKILVGVDGLDGGRDAAALARLLADTAHADVVLAHAYPWEVTPRRPLVESAAGRLRHDAQVLLEREGEQAGLPRAALIPIGDVHPARGLHQLAEQEHADLLVLGSAHRHGLGRVMLGDVAASALHGAPCPVAVAPSGFREGNHELRRVGVGFDGSSEAHAAVTLAAELARDAAGELRVFTVFDDGLPLLMPYPSTYAVVADDDEYIRSRRRDAEDQLAEVVDAGARDRTGEVLLGRPGDALETVSSDLDLLVVGSRDYGPVRRVMLGGTARHLAHHARCPLLVLPRGATTGAEDRPGEGAHGGRGDDLPEPPSARPSAV